MHAAGEAARAAAAASARVWHEYEAGVPRWVGRAVRRGLVGLRVAMAVGVGSRAKAGCAWQGPNFSSNTSAATALSLLPPPPPSLSPRPPPPGPPAGSRGCRAAARRAPRPPRPPTTPHCSGAWWTTAWLTWRRCRRRGARWARGATRGCVRVCAGVWGRAGTFAHAHTPACTHEKLWGCSVLCANTGPLLRSSTSGAAGCADHGPLRGCAARACGGSALTIGHACVRALSCRRWRLRRRRRRRRPLRAVPQRCWMRATRTPTLMALTMRALHPRHLKRRAAIAM